MNGATRAEIHRLQLLWQELEEQHRPVEADAILRRIERLSEGAD